jgi:DNA-binding response OmpR family regulator
MKILQAVNGDRFAQFLAMNFRSQGMTVDIISFTEDLYDLVRENFYDLLIVSLEFPERPGTDMVRTLRRKGCCKPVLALTTSTSVQDRIEALNAGADDCLMVTAPFEELLARSRALLRRPPQTVGPTYELGNIRLDATAASVMVEEQRISLPRREIALLELLMRHRSCPVPRERLEHALFSIDDEVTPNALEAAISRLRRHLKMNAATVNVVATRGLGYSLSNASNANNLMQYSSPA